MHSDLVGAARDPAVGKQQKPYELLRELNTRHASTPAVTEGSVLLQGLLHGLWYNT